MQIKGDEIRHGDRVYLDALSKSLIEAMNKVALSEAMLWQLYDGSAAIKPMSAGDFLQHFKTDSDMPFALRLQKDETCIGAARLHETDWKSRRTQLHIAIVQDDFFTGEILRDIIKTMLHFAYHEANLNRVKARCIADNTLLAEALLATGFTEEGRLRQHVYRDGQYQDILIYSMLQREWAE